MQFIGNIFVIFLLCLLYMLFSGSLDEGISMEPRLMQYLEEKKQCKINGHEPQIPLHKKYSINENDKQIINRYLRGDKKLYDENNFSGGFVKARRSQFLSDNIKNDPRFERLKNKIERDKHANTVRHEYMGSMDHEYVVKDFMENSRHIPHQNMYADHADHTIPGHTEPDIAYRTISDREDAFSTTRTGVRTCARTSAHTSVTQKRRERHTKRHNKDTERLVRGLDQYQQKIQMRPSRKSIKGDYSESKSHGNSMVQRPKKINGRFASEPIFKDMSDIEVDNYIREGTQTKTSKSHGYDNPYEHFFDIRSDEKQLPEHCIFDRPQATRLDNKVSVSDLKKKNMMRDWGR